MRYQEQRPITFESIPIIVDEDTGIPTTLIDNYREHIDSGPCGPDDPRSLLVSMSEYGKAPNYDIFEYHPTTRPSEQAADYATFPPAHPQYAADYIVGTQAQAAFLPAAPSNFVDGPHDAAAEYYEATPEHPSAYATSSTYLDPGIRQLPEILSYAPAQGSHGTKVSICFQSIYDLQSQPGTSIVVMFGQKRCDSVLSRTSHSSSPYQYIINASAPSIASTGSTTSSPQVTLSLAFDAPGTWASPTLDIGTFTYSGEYGVSTPVAQQRKRKLSLDADDRASPSKRQIYSRSALPGQAFYPPDVAPLVPATSHRLSDSSISQRRYSQPEYNFVQALPRAQAQHYYPASATGRLQSPQSYGYMSTLRSPIATIVPATRTAQLLPSPSGHPPLIRTSTIQQSPSSSIPSSTTQTFNPYAMYPANAKAMLKIEGDLNSMVEGWSEAEWDVKRRLVQFQRSQQGSVISTTFEATTPADRLPNSICVSCIWWEEKAECYVTSVDTIQLLESLVAVRFTVEEKNRIRRNLEGFRPATVSKTKADSEEFFKLIMGFPNPKPRNIEKDVKVFPWRILSTALKKIIGKYSASYSSTAGALHTPASSYLAHVTDAGFASSPRSTSSSSTTHGHTYATAAINAQTFLPTANPLLRSQSDMAAGPPDLQLAVPQMASWHPSQASAPSSSALSVATPISRQMASWDYPTGLGGYGMATPGLPTPSSQGQYQFGAMRLPAQQATPVHEARFIPLHDYEHQSHQKPGPP